MQRAGLNLQEVLMGGQQVSPEPDGPSLSGGIVHKHLCPFMSFQEGVRA